MTLRDDPRFEVATSGYATFEEDGVMYRRKERFVPTLDVQGIIQRFVADAVADQAGKISFTEIRRS